MIIIALPLALLTLISIGIILLAGLLWSISFWLIFGLALIAACFLGLPLALLSGLIVGVTCIPIPLLLLAVGGFFLMRKIRS